jgi:hypothetical protein
LFAEAALDVTALLSPAGNWRRSIVIFTCSGRRRHRITVVFRQRVFVLSFRLGSAGGCFSTSGLPAGRGFKYPALR